MQQLGYFHRPTASVIYFFLIVFAFSLFLFNLLLFYKSRVSLFYLKISTVASTLILALAYPFLSSDLFNYLFDAKIILDYQANPYTHRPLDFPQDPWLRFMRWTHRYSPYGPLWLLMSLIPSSLAFGKFILNFFLFKIFMASFHLINSYLIYKILQKINPKKVLLGTAFYALNPLFLLESVANAHNDVVMSTFLLSTVYFLIYKKVSLSYISLFAGTLIKYIPILNLPFLIWLSLSRKKSVRVFIILNVITLAIFTFIFSSFRLTVPFVSSGATQVQFQPWYLFWTLPLASLIPSLTLIALSLAVSLGASLRYLPYLFYGDWSHPGTIMFMQMITVTPIIIVLATLAFTHLGNRPKIV